MRVELQFGILETTDGYLHAALPRKGGPIAVCGAGGIAAIWPENFDTDDARSCPACSRLINRGGRGVGA